MRQVAASEQGHKRRRKWLQALVIRFESRFPTDSIAYQHDDKVNHAERCRSVCGRSEPARRFRKASPDGSSCGREEPLHQTMQAPRGSARPRSEDSPRKDCPYSYALLSLCFPLAKPRLNGCQEHSILSNEGSHHLNLLSVCHTMTSSSPKATSYFTVCLMSRYLVAYPVGGAVQDQDEGSRATGS